MLVIFPSTSIRGCRSSTLWVHLMVHAHHAPKMHVPKKA